MSKPTSKSRKKRQGKKEFLQESNSAKARKVLDAMRVSTGNRSKTWNVFQIGCVSTPLNFASQQMRAFKLVWALDNLNLIQLKKVAIVGGGLAGVTAGVVCLLRGASTVALYDRAHELMAFQRGAVHRYVHPMIFRWPDEAADLLETHDFKILKWKSGTADEIRQKVIQEANRCLDECHTARGQTRKSSTIYRQRLGCDVRQIRPDGTEVGVLAEGQESIWVKERNEALPVGGIRNYYDTYDVVIVAVGYGLESEVENIPFRSYWNLDILSQSTIRGIWPRRWLVSGTGDGGLIDAIRLRLFDIDQKALTELLTGEGPKSIEGFDVGKDWKAKMTKLRHELGKSDQEIRSKYARRQNSAEVKNQISREIHEQFDMLRRKRGHKGTFNTLRDFLWRYERTDTLVYLNGLQETPYELNASLFNRFLIYLLRRYCGLRYRRGEMRLSKIPQGSTTYRVDFEREVRKSKRVPIDVIEVDDVVIRHGAESSFGALFGEQAVKYARENSEASKFEKDLWTDLFHESWMTKLQSPVVSKTKLR